MDQKCSSPRTKLVSLIRSMRTATLLLALTVCGASLALPFIHLRGHAAEGGGAVRVGRKDLRITLTEKGTVEASETHTVYTQVFGEIVHLIEEGTDVKEGDVVARLSNEEIEEEYEEAKLDLELAESQLRRAKEAFDLLKKKLDLTVRQRKSETDLAKWELESVRRQADETEIKRREMAAETRKLQLEFAEIELESAKRLKDTMSVGSIEDYMQRETAKREAEVEYNRAKELYETAKSEPNRKRLEVAVGRLHRAERGLVQAELDRKERVVVAAKDIDIQAANTEKIRDQVERLRQEIEHLAVRSPSDGKVVYPEVFKGSSEERSRVRVGETRWRSGDLMVISNVSTMIVRVPVNECDASKVKVGQEATIRLLAYPEKTYRAHAVEVLPYAMDKNVRLGSLAVARDGLAGIAVVDVLLEIEDSDDNMRLGLTAEVQILVDTVKDALVIPHTAVTHPAGNAVCRVIRDGRAADQEVKLGPSNEFDVVVLEGLSEGDALLDGLCRE
ncbi:MAG: efflux RND transporter periplasmic adaptor subunit [Planctomycetota bacterium]